MKPTPPCPCPCLRIATRGISLIECLITLAVLAILLSTALPEMKNAMERRRLEGAAAQLETDIHHARSVALANNHSVRMKFSRQGAGSCYLVFRGAAGQCSCDADGSSQCQGQTQSPQSVWRSVGFAPQDAVRLESNVTSVVFDPALGTITPTGTFTLRGRSGQSIQLIVNIMGRVRSCSPTGIAGYRPCQPAQP